VVDIHSD